MAQNKVKIDINSHHENHRSRLRERYTQNGIDSFTECEILEMLLPLNFRNLYYHLNNHINKFFLY